MTVVLNIGPSLTGGANYSGEKTTQFVTPISSDDCLDLSVAGCVKEYI